MFQTKNMKKSSIPWLFAVIFLTILLFVSVYLGVTGFYFSANYLSSNTDLTIGDTVSIVAKTNQSTPFSMTFDGSFLTGEALRQVIQINSENTSDDVYLRVKATVFGGEEEKNLEFVTTDHFEMKEDGYYYYDEALNAGNKITFCNYIVIPASSKFVSKEKYVLTLTVETLSTSVDASTIWKNLEK